MTRQALIQVLNGERIDPPPVWIMRQAGRYLPEYRQLRSQAKDFLTFCYTPALACEAVLQPLRRFDLDAAILFSDILVIPDALGHKVRFVEGEGPRLAPLADQATWRIGDVEQVIERLSPVYETVERLRAALPCQNRFDRLCGRPLDSGDLHDSGRGRREKTAAGNWPMSVRRTSTRCWRCSSKPPARHLAAQVAAGADCLQIFESWSEGLPERMFERVILRPTQTLVARLRTLGVTVPVIGFPRGAAPHCWVDTPAKPA